MVTIKDIGRAIGVSHATVSRALNNSSLVNPETRDLVQRTAKEMGYQPDTAARILRGSSANIVGFVLPDITNAFYSRIASIVSRYASDRGLQLVLATTDDDPQREEHHLIELRRARACAVIITPSAEMTPKSVDLLNGMLTLQMVRRHPALNSDLVIADDRGGVEAATRHLLANGHRRVAYIGGGATTLSTGEDRLTGYLAAMAEAGVTDLARHELGPPQPEFGREMTLRLLAGSEPPDAIVAGSSQLTIGLIEALLQSGRRVPETLSFTGYDDPDWFALWGPGISTVQLPIDQIARAVATIAAGQPVDQDAARIETEASGARTIRFPCTFKDRGTVRPR